MFLLTLTPNTTDIFSGKIYLKIIEKYIRDIPWITPYIYFRRNRCKHFRQVPPQPPTGGWVEKYMLEHLEHMSHRINQIQVYQMIKKDNFHSLIYALSGIPAILSCILALGFYFLLIEIHLINFMRNTLRKI